MFTSVRFKNFRSFGDVSLNLKNNTTFKHFALIYGENGMGKSNLALGFSALNELTNTMNVRDILEQFLSSKDFEEAIENPTVKDSAMKFFQRQINMNDMKNLIEKYRTINTTKPVSLEYEFSINNKKGKYLISLGNEEVIHERLEFTLRKNKGIYFDLTPNKKKLNTNIFNDNNIVTDINKLISKFWGKHTLLSILLHEKEDKSQKYIDDGISENFKAVIKELTNVYYLTKLNNRQTGFINNSLLINLARGKISLKQESKLNLSEKILSKIFHAINSDNRRLYYKKEIKDNKIDYTLYITKFIAGKEREFPFYLESRGNHQILNILPFLFSALLGNIAIVDEIDTGIHDLLFKKIIEEIKPLLKGQLIITSHNTTLLEINSIRDNVYFITEDETANKFIKCTTDYKERTYQQNNMRNKYLNNAYGGIPKITNINFAELINMIKANK